MSNKPEYVTIHDKVFKLMYGTGDIDMAISRIAKRINNDYENKTPLYIIVLKGAVFFAVDLLKQVHSNCAIETLSAKSYGSTMQSNGNVQLWLQNLDLKDKDVIIIEDIVDTGFTIQSLLAKLRQFEPRSIEVAALISKPDQRKVDVPVKYIGFDVHPVFIVGYGLDYNEHGRNLTSIYALYNENEEVEENLLESE